MTQAVRSWRSVWGDLFPEEHDFHDDEAAAEMHRLRGVVMAQAAETEAVLGMIARLLDPGVPLTRPAGILLKHVQKVLGRLEIHNHDEALTLIDRAIQRRNRTVHDTVVIGSVWNEYATGGGDWVNVISIMGEEEYTENDLERDVALQHDATAAAVRVFRSLRDDPRIPSPTQPVPEQHRPLPENDLDWSTF